MHIGQSFLNIFFFTALTMKIMDCSQTICTMQILTSKISYSCHFETVVVIIFRAILSVYWSFLNIVGRARMAQGTHYTGSPIYLARFEMSFFSKMCRKKKMFYQSKLSLFNLTPSSVSFASNLEKVIYWNNYHK